MKRRSGGAAGKILTLMLLLAGAGVVYYVYETGMLPTKHLAVIGTAAAVLVGLVGFLTWDFYSRGKFVIGLFLWFAVLMLFAVAGMYVHQTRSTISEITTVDKEVSSMGVFVKSDSAAASLADTGTATYGILRDLDRQNTDAAIAKIQEETGTVPATMEYEGLTELVDSVVSGETQAIVLNEAYVDVIRELEGYSALDAMIRQVAKEEVETEVQRPTVPVYASAGTGTDGTDEAGDAGTVTIDTESGESVQVAAAPNKDVLVVYLSGIDNRGGIVAKSRSDVNIVAVANMATKQMLLINTPRDYFVPLSISNGAPDKLTHAGIYGINCSMDTLSMLYTVAIPYYVKVNFQGFIDIIDSMGGIDVESDYTFDSKNELGWHYNAGINHMDGEAALTFARERFSFADGDRQRGKNQMAVIKGILDKASSGDVLKNYTTILKSLEGSFETNITYDEIARIMTEALQDGESWNLVTYSVNGTGATEKPFSLSAPAYVMVPDQSTVDTARMLIWDVMQGMTLEQTSEEIIPLLSEEEANAIAAEENGLLVTPSPAPGDATPEGVAPAVGGEESAAPESATPVVGGVAAPESAAPAVGEEAAPA